MTSGAASATKVTVRKTGTRSSPTCARQPEAGQKDARQRLLQAAIEVFSEKGFDAATVREISARARTNVAMVNYYFGDKLELYTQVLKAAIRAGRAHVSEVADPDPEEALRRMIRAMLDRALEKGDDANLRYRIMMHELMRPTAATARVVDIAIRPVYDRLREAVAAVLGPESPDQTIRLCAHSIIGQVLHFAHSSRVSALWPGMTMTPEQRDMVAAHVADVMSCYMAGRKRGARPAQLD